MKMVLVFDTEDWHATRGSFQLALQFFRTHGMIAPMDKVSFNKIAMIKAVRDVARAVESGKLDSGLRKCKEYADKNWMDWNMS